MEIVHESPSPDLSFTVRAPLTLVDSNGLRLSIERWGLQGFAVDERWAKVPQSGRLAIPFQGVDITFPVALTHDPDQKFVYFANLTGPQRETLALFYRNLMSGRMAATDEVITSLDTPVDLVPMGETDEEQKQGMTGKSPRVLRVAYNIAVYVLLSYFVFGILGGSVWSRIDTIDIQHGRIDVPQQMMTAPDTGVVVATPVVPGSEVRAGDLLVEIRDARRDAEVEVARLAVTQAEAALDEVQAAIADLDRARAPETALRLRLAKAAMHHVAFFKTTSFDDLRLQWVDLRRTDPEAAKELDPLKITLERLNGLRSIRAAELRAARDVLQRHETNANALNIYAPADGHVQDVLAAAGSAVRGGAPLITVEADSALTMVGWASERLAETLYIGMPASIGYNLGGERQSTTGAIVDLRAGEDPTRPGEFGIIVTVAGDSFAQGDARDGLKSGAPVNLSAEKQLAHRAVASAKTLYEAGRTRTLALFDRAEKTLLAARSQ